ncbi:hypothetical protein MCEMRE196_01057 [Candidatus Nanopelagicaceae bacterium]
MEILKFENAPAPRKSAPKKSNLKSLAGLATVAAVAVLGSTLAANISLGTGSALEFGQGVQTTSACDSSIVLSPKVTFQNSANPQFVLSTISFTDVDAQAGACRGDVLTLNAYGNTAATPLQIATNGSTAVSEARIYVNATTPTSLTGGVVTALVANQGASNAAFDVAFTTPSATSGAVYKLTLQSSNN